MSSLDSAVDHTFPPSWDKRLLPFEITIVDALTAQGSMKVLPALLHVKRGYIKSRLYDIRHKTDCRTTRELAFLWPCEIFQIGLRALGIRR